MCLKFHLIENMVDFEKVNMIDFEMCLIFHPTQNKVDFEMKSDLTEKAQHTGFTVQAKSVPRVVF